MSLIPTKRSKSVTHRITLQKILKKKASFGSKPTLVLIIVSQIQMWLAKRRRSPVESSIRETKQMLWNNVSLQATILINDLAANVEANKTRRQHKMKHNSTAICVRSNTTQDSLTYLMHQCAHRARLIYLRKTIKTKSRARTSAVTTSITIFSILKRMPSKEN